MFSPPRELKDSFLSFQAMDTSVASHPESDQFTVPHQHLAKQMTPPRKPLESVPKLNGDQNQSPQFKSISSLDQAADDQLFEIPDPPLDSENSSITKFIASPQSLQKELVQHRPLAKEVVGTTKQFAKSQLQKKTVVDEYRDPNMNEAYSKSLPLQSQANREGPSEKIEHPEYPLEAQTQESENLDMVHESPEYLPVLPEEDEPSVPKENPVQHHFASGKAAALKHPDRNAPSPKRNEARHSKLPNVTVKPEDLEVTVMSEADKETQQTLSQQQAPGHLPESPKEVEPSSTPQDTLEQFSGGPEEIETLLTHQEAAAPNPELPEELGPSLVQQEVLSESLELPKDLEASGSQLEVPARRTKPPEEVNPPTEQEARIPTPEPSMPNIIEIPAATVSHHNQDQVHHYTLPTITVQPADVEVTITSKPFKEAEISPVQEETQTPGPPRKVGHYSLEQQPAVSSESSGEVGSLERYLGFLTQPPEEEEEEEEEEDEESSLTQEDIPSQHPSPILEGEPSPIELQQPIRPSESPEEVGLGPENQSEVLVKPAELPEEVKSPVEQEAPLQAPESHFETIVDTPPIHEVQPAPNKAHHHHWPNVTVRPVDLELAITSEPTRETESSLAQQESSVHPSEYTEERDSFRYKQEQLAQPSKLEILIHTSEHHHLTSSPSAHHRTHHSSSPTTMVRPPDVQLTIAQNPTAEVEPPPALHEVVGKPIAISDKGVNTSTHHTHPAVTPEPSEEVELLSNQEEAPVQSAEPVEYEKSSLSQQKSTDKNPELLEEGGLSSAQQETLVNPPVFPNEMIVQPSAHYEATGPPLIQTQLHPPASYNVTAKPPELTNEVETSSQQGVEPSNDQQEEVTSQYPMPPETHQDSPVYQWVLTQPAKLPEEVSSGQQGNLSPPLKHPPGVQFIPFQQELPDQHLEPPKEGFFLSPVADSVLFSPEDLEAMFRYETSVLHKPTVIHLNQAVSSMEVESLKVPTEQVEYSQVHFEYPSYTPAFPETQFSQEKSITQEADLHEDIYPFPTQHRGLYLPPDSFMGAEPSVTQHLSLSQLEDLAENVGPSLVLQLTPAQASEPPKEIVFSPTQQVVPNQLPESLNNIVTQLLTQQIIGPTPGQIQEEYPTEHTVSFQALDLEFTITSQYTPEANHTTEPKRTPPPTYPQVTFSYPSEVTVQPLDLGLTISPQPTPEELPQAIPEITTQITEPPREVVAPAPLYQKMTVPTPGQDQVEYPIPPAISFQPLDLELTKNSEPTRETQQPTATMKTIVPSPEHLQDYISYVAEVTVQPLDLGLTISPQSAPEELPQPMPEITTQITEPPREVVAPAPLYQKMTVPTPGQDGVEYPILTAVSFQPLDQKLTISSEPTREVHHSTTPKETTVPPPKLSQVTLPREFHIQNLYLSEAAVQPVDLGLTITPQPNSEELPQTISEITTQITEPPKELVAPLYQEVTVPTPGQDQAEYPTLPVASFQPLDPELTISSEPTRETEQPTAEVTVQSLDLELTISLQSTPEELLQTMPEITTQITEPPGEVVTPLYQEVTVSTPSLAQTEYPTSHIVSFQPLDLELTKNSEPTRETQQPTATMKTIVPSPEHLQDYISYVAEVTVQPLNLGLTISPQSAPEELPQPMPEITTQITEPPREVVAPAPLYQKMTIPTPGQDQDAHSTTLQPVGLELTETSDSTREAEHYTTLVMTTVSSPKYSLPEQVLLQHLNPAEVTVQALDLGLTITPQPDTEKELSQTTQESTTQLIDPPKEAVAQAPVYQEVTLATPSQDAFENPTLPIITFRLLDPDPEPAREADNLATLKETTIPPPKYPPVTLPEQVHTQHPHPSEVTFQPLDMELSMSPQPTPEVELSQAEQETKTQPSYSAKEVVTPKPGYPEVTVPTPDQDKTEDQTLTAALFQPLDLELTRSSEPTTPHKSTVVSLPQYYQTTLSGEVYTQHPNLTEVTDQPLNLELTVIPSPNLNVETSPHIQEMLPEPERPHEEVTAKAPMFYEITPIQDQTPHLVSPKVTDQHIKVEHDIPTISSVENGLLAATYSSTALPLTHHEMVLLSEDQVQVLHGNPTQVTIHPSHPEFSLASPPATMVKRSAPVQSTESSKETAAQSPVHLKETVLMIAHGQSQHLNSETTQPEVPATTHPETTQSTASPTTHSETTHSTASPTTHPDTTQSTASPTTHPETTQSTASPTTHSETTQSTTSPTTHPETTQSTASPTTHPDTTQSTASPTIHPDTTQYTTSPTTHPETTQYTDLTTMPPPSTHYEVVLSQSSQVQTQQPKPSEVTMWPSPTSQQSSTTPQSVILASPFATMLETTAQQIPSGIALEPMDLEPTITPYAGNFNTEKDLIFQMKPNVSTSTNICDLCLCENHTLLCSHLSPKRRLHQVPVLRPGTHKGTLTILNFHGNVISYIDKNVWKAYRWAEKLILSENRLTELHKESFEGLLTLQVLDLSCNKIHYIERRTFESLPFLKYINLGCNLLTELNFGTFQAWHGMQFLQQLILNHNPLTVVEDPFLFKLPTLKYLDLGATQVQLTMVENILMMMLELEHLILPSRMACCLCKFKADIEIICKTIKLRCHTGCLTNTTHCLKASIGDPEGAFMKALLARKENSRAELTIEPEKSYADQTNLGSLGLMNEQLDFNDESDVISALNYILPYFSEGNLEDVVSTLLPFIKLLFSNIQNGDNSLGPFQNDTKSLTLKSVPKASKLAYKNKVNKLYFLENLLDEEINEVKEKEKTAMLVHHSGRLDPKFKRQIFEKRWEPARTGKDSLAEIEKAERQLHSMSRVPKETGSIQKRHFKDVSGKSLWSKQSVQTPVESISKDRQLGSPPSMELQQLGLEQKPRELVGYSFPSEPLLPKEHRGELSSSPDLPLLDKAPTTNSLPDFIDRRKDLSYTIYVLESANANVKRAKGSNPSLQPEARHRNLRKKKSHFQLIAKRPAASSAVRSLISSSARGVFSSLGDLRYPERPFSELYVAPEPSTKKPLEENRAATDNVEENNLKQIVTTPEETTSENKPPENPTADSNVSTTSNLISTVQQTSKPQSVFTVGADTHADLTDVAYPSLMSPGEQFESHLNQQLLPLIPNKDVRRLISHVIRTLKMDCSDTRVQMSCAKLISRTGLLMKLLSEQQDFKLSRADWDTDQWKTENYINESTETQGEQRSLEPSQLTKAVPGYGYNNKVILAISVTVIVTVLIIIFCLIEIYSHRTAKEGDEEKSSRYKKNYYKISETQDGFFWLRCPLWLRDMYRPLHDTRKKNMAQDLQDKESSGEEEIFNKDVPREFKRRSSVKSSAEESVVEAPR
uniref:Leucine rich repeat containing 37A n=2 Tax=Mus musculus TaxID=10090 RepID=B1AWG4_MOUSE